MSNLEKKIGPETGGLVQRFIPKKEKKYKKEKYYILRESYIMVCDVNQY